MIRVLTLVVPLALVGAVSPVMLSEQTFLLSGHDGRRIAGRYAVGVAVTLLVILGALVIFGRSVALPERPSLSATLDIVLGSVLLGLAVILRRRRPRPRRDRTDRRRGLSPNAALGFGVFSMATNFTTLTVVVLVAKEIAASDLDVPRRLIVIMIVVAVAALPAWLPVALTMLAPGPADRGLSALAGFIDTRGPLLTVLLLAAVGLFLVGSGVIHLIGA